MKSLLKQESKEVIGLAIFLIAAGCLLLFLGMETAAVRARHRRLGADRSRASFSYNIFFISRVSVSAIPLLLGDHQFDLRLFLRPGTRGRS
ncbi:MAG: hypothetical protein ACOX1W_01700 [Catenisphaera adipataccumulans]|uniref:hypothetical protein n=1 Tax=Catenisphaera adipataccumulans TaxID=700500 RepID=UPI003D8A6CA4